MLHSTRSNIKLSFPSQPICTHKDYLYQLYSLHSSFKSIVHSDLNTVNYYHRTVIHDHRKRFLYLWEPSKEEICFHEKQMPVVHLFHFALGKLSLLCGHCRTLPQRDDWQPEFSTILIWWPFPSHFTVVHSYKKALNFLQRICEVQLTTSIH